MKNFHETYTCSICNTEINTAGSKMIVDRDEDLCFRGTLCVHCHGVVSRDDPFILLQAIEYILLGGYPEEFEDDGEMPKPKKAEIRRGLREEDRDLLERKYGVREFTTLRDDEFTIPKLKGRKKAAPKKAASRKKGQGRKPAKKKASPLKPRQHREVHQSGLAA